MGKGMLPVSAPSANAASSSWRLIIVARRHRGVSTSAVVGRAAGLATQGGATMQGDAEVLELRNEQLTAELTAINQYFLHAKVEEHFGWPKPAAQHSPGRLRRRICLDFAGHRFRSAASGFVRCRCRGGRGGRGGGVGRRG